MAEIGISIAAKLIEVIGSKIIKDICDTWGYKCLLEDLNKSIMKINNVLLAADAKRELTLDEQSVIEELKEVVYDADDLFDEFLTLVELNQIHRNNKGAKFSEKVLTFFSSSKNKISKAYRVSRKVKDIKKELNEIVERHTKFVSIIVDYKPIIRRREETCSYVDDKEIIGRDKDKDAIIDMLLDRDGKGDCSFLTIVGVGGLGKTALAQLVYNDERVKIEFHDLRYWVCVSDQDGGQFDVKEILCKLLEVVTKEKVDNSSALELVQSLFQEKLRGKKYFLVLDDVWNEDRQKWRKLAKLLLLGQGESKILVTTRSEKTTAVIGENLAYRLEGLSEKNSWRLFAMSAFHIANELENHHELAVIGKKIVANCYSIPLAIKVVGSLLFGQEINKWRSFEASGLSQIGRGDNEIMSILKLSYHNLIPSLKSCFSYCAVFPKDYQIRKKWLIDLWMAQGFVVPSDGGQSIEDAADEHFVILLRRCFFQDVKKDVYGDVYSVKIHDLMHDVAQEVGREEICIVNDNTKNLGDKIRHVCCVVDRGPQIISSCSHKIRSYINVGCKEPQVDTLINNWMCLRVLDLSNSDVENLPNSIGKLLHLRYLNLSGNENLLMLPDAITKLHNLQTLLLERCRSLKELPKAFCKLVKLRHFDFWGCEDLIGMPLGMDKLTSLRLLPFFVVGIEEQSNDELKALKGLTGIKGFFCIRIGKSFRIVEGMNDTGGGGYLKGMKHLTRVGIRFDKNDGGCVNPKAVLETLEPPSNIKSLFISFYLGTTINWTIFPSHLVDIDLHWCHNLQELPVLSKLPHLKSLTLLRLNNLEYMEITNCSSSSDSDTEAATQELPTFFPSLERLILWNLKKLKGLGNRRSSSFPRLSELEIKKCPDLTWFPPCPSLEQLKLEYNNEALQIIVKLTTRGKEKQEENAASAGYSQGDYNVKLRKVEIDNLVYLKSLTTNCLTHLEITVIDSMEEEFESADSEEEIDSEVVKEEVELEVVKEEVELEVVEEEVELEVVEAFQKSASSLHSLKIEGINKPKRLTGRAGLEHFSALDELTLTKVDDFEVSFPQNLRNLKIEDCQNMTSLPMRLQYLTSLQTLHIEDCYELNSLPEWISNLTSLQSLTIKYCLALKSLPEAMKNLTSLQILWIRYCPDLINRCEKPNGEDYPKIQHIPKIVLI